MPAPRKLPDCDTLLTLVENGLTNREIGDRYETSGEAVRQALLRCGYKRNEDQPTHAKYLPWTIKMDHYRHPFVRLLRLASRREQGLPLKPSEQRALDDWCAYMDGANPTAVALSVHYDRADPEGFWLEPRRPGDRNFIAPPREAEWLAS